METLKVQLATGETREINRRGFAVKFWNAGKWNNAGAFEENELDKAEALRSKYVHEYKYQCVEIVQLW